MYSNRKTTLLFIRKCQIFHWQKSLELKICLKDFKNIKLLKFLIHALNEGSTKSKLFTLKNSTAQTTQLFTKDSWLQDSDHNERTKGQDQQWGYSLTSQYCIPRIYYWKLICFHNFVSTNWFPHKIPAYLSNLDESSFLALLTCQSAKLIT